MILGALGEFGGQTAHKAPYMVIDCSRLLLVEVKPRVHHVVTTDGYECGEG